MKHSLPALILALSVATSASAQLGADGYYRVKNYQTERYVYVVDDKSKIDMGASTIDLGALDLWKGLEKALTDPSTVLYITKVGSKYDISAQGTGVYTMTGEYLSISDMGNGTYKAHGTKNGLTKYLGDGEKAPTSQGGMIDSGKGDYARWNIYPVSSSSDYYLAVKPTVSAGSDNYASYYASFPYALSSGMSAFYVASVDSENGVAVIKEVTGNAVPEATPVIIRCKSSNYADNKLDVGAGNASALSDNMLKGVYFDNNVKLHYNRTANDKATMRVLGIKADGKIGFIQSDLEFLPHNEAYLPVPEGTPAELQIMTEDEYRDFLADVPSIIVDGVTEFDVYDIHGLLIRSHATGVQDLPAGFYILRGTNGATSKIVVR